MKTLKGQVATLALALAAIAPLPAQAADLAVKPRPHIAAPAPAPQSECAYVEVQLQNWTGPATFRVIAVGAKAPGRMEMPVTLAAGATQLCIPRDLFRAEKIQVCIGDTSRDKSNSRIIQGRWMAIARANLAKGDVINPGEPMHFRYNGPSQRRPAYGNPQRHRHHQRHASVPPMVKTAIAVASSVLLSRALHR